MRTTVRAELKRLHSPDADPVTFVPVSDDNFSIFLQAMIGREGSDAEESFDFVVCTPKWLDQQCSVSGAVILGVGYIVVNRYKHDEIEEAISRLCASTEGDTWDELARKLSQFARWEFEGYVAR